MRAADRGHRGLTRGAAESVESEESGQATPGLGQVSKCATNEINPACRSIRRRVTGRCNNRARLPLSVTTRRARLQGAAGWEAPS
jgi:hypothetical protein